MVAISRQRPVSAASSGSKAARPSQAQKVAPVNQGQGAYNELSDAGTLLDKQKIVPTEDSLNEAHESGEKQPPRLGQLIDVLV